MCIDIKKVNKEECFLIWDRAFVSNRSEFFKVPVNKWNVNNAVMSATKKMRKPFTQFYLKQVRTYFHEYKEIKANGK